MEPKILMSFKKLSDPGLDFKAKYIIACLTDNVHFPTPSPALSVLSTASDEYSVALTNAQSRDKTAVIIKDNKREALEGLLKQEAAYLMFAAKGSREILSTTGYDLSKATRSSTTLTPPQTYTLSYGYNPGEIISTVSTVPGAKSYRHLYTKSPVTENSDWQIGPGDTASTTISNLEIGTLYVFYVKVIGANQQEVQTEMLSKIAV